MNHNCVRLMATAGFLLFLSSVSQAQVIGVYGAPSVVYVPGQSGVAYQPAYSPIVTVAASPVVMAVPASPVYLQRPVVATPVYSPAVTVPAATVVMGVRPTAVRETVRYQPHGYTYSAQTYGVANSNYRLRVNEHRNGVTIRERVR